MDDRDAVKSEVLAQHQHLDVLLQEVREALQAGDGGGALREAFSQLRSALETHFEQEDRLYYPSIWALRPTQKARLHACVDAHAGFRSMLRDIARLLEVDELGAARESFDLFSQGFEIHEDAEEAILAELDHEMALREDGERADNPRS